MMSNGKKAPARAALAPMGTRLLLVAVAAAALSACKHTDDPSRVAGWTLIDASQRHPILVSQEPTTHEIRISRGANGLTSAQRRQLISFTDYFRATDTGNSRLVVTVPSGGSNEVGAMYAVGQIRDLLRDYGFAEDSISVEAYDAEGLGAPPIRVSYLRYVAQPPQCGDWSTNLAYEPMNLPYPNFGCAGQRNFGAQVANPADLLGPRSMTARSSERRDQVWSRYVNGKSTGAQRTLQDAVNTSSN